MKKRLLFGAWEPDAVEMASGGVGLAQCINVVPVTRGYRSIPGWGRAYGGNSVPVAITGTVATYTSIVGAFSATNRTGFPVDFFSDTSNVYMADFTSAAITSLGSIGDIAPLGSPLGFRDFTQYGNLVLAASGLKSTAADPKYFDLGSSSAFATLTTSFKARTVGVLRDFVVWGGTYDATDGERQSRVRWSAFGDAFTYTPSAATQSDIQDLTSDAGAVWKVVGGDNAFIVCTNSVYLMEYVGPPVVMRFTQIQANIGTTHPQSCVRLGDYLYMWSSAGFVRIGTAKGDVEHIGAGKVDQEFMSRTHLNGDTYLVTAYLDVRNQVIGWVSDKANGTAFCYHYPSGRWVVHGDRSGAYFLYSSGMSNYTPSQTNLLRLQTAHALATDGNLYAQNNMEQCAAVTIGTGFEELNPGARALVDRVRPIAESRATDMQPPVLTIYAIPNYSIQVLNPSYSSTGTYNSTDACWTGTGAGFNDGRYHKFELDSNPSTRSPTEQYYGLDVIFHPRGEF